MAEERYAISFTFDEWMSLQAYLDRLEIEAPPLGKQSNEVFNRLRHKAELVRKIHCKETKLKLKRLK